MTGQADCPHREFFEAEDQYVCRICGKRLAPAGYTRVTDATGTRWVKYEPRKRRKAGRAVRFADVKVGDELVCIRASSDIAPDEMTRHVVTDLWFDPVAGERDEIAGQMVAVRWIRNGQPVGSKRQHTRRGLAMQGFHYADKAIAAREALAESISAQIDTIRASTAGRP